MVRSRFAVLLGFSLGACASPQHAPPPCPSASPPVAAAPSAPPGDAEVVLWSHGALEAFDRGDATALAAALSTGYQHFEGGAPTTRDDELKALAGRKSGAPLMARRVWSHEHVAVHEPYAIFVGRAQEHSAGNDVHGGNDYDGWYTLTWCREGGAWKLALWTWQRAGGARDSWNDTFRRGIGFNKEPNRFLVDAVATLAPGAALDIAMGQGRNALYLASRGWKVTGVDISDEGVRVAREAASARHLALDAVNADLDAFEFGSARWDLVTMIYAAQNAAWVERAKRSLKPGGLFVLEDFHKDARDDGGFATGQLAAIFKDGFDVLRDDVLETVPDWASDRATIERFVARKR